MVGIPRPPNFYRADASVDSAAIDDDAVGAVDVANSLVYDMVAKTAPVGADALLLNDSEASNINKKVTITNLMNTAAGTETSTALTDAVGVLTVSPGGATAKTAPVAADKILVCDTEAANINKSVTIANATKALSPNALTAKTAPVAADELILGDTEASNVAKKVTVSNLTKALGISAVTAKTTPISADATLINDSAASNVAKSVTLANMAAFYGAIAQMPVDIASSLFFHALEVDFGVATAVDEKLTDSAAAKGKLLLTIGVVTEAFNGDADNTITISNNTLLGANPMCSNIVVDKDAAQNGNWLASVFAGMPVAGADATVAASADIYAYSAANTNRGTGKMYFFLVLQKTA